MKRVAERAAALQDHLDLPRCTRTRAFARQRGTRWNLENLRFRTAQETADTLASDLPRTVKLLTRGTDDWLQDLSCEYLSWYRWRQLGHLRFAECERFAAYARERIARRRPLPRHFDAVLDFELATVRLLKRTAAIPPDRWPPPPGALSDQALARVVPRHSEAMELFDLPVDGRTSVAELQRRLLEELDLEGPQVASALRRWLEARVLWT